jgi:hypothetical protein
MKYRKITTGYVTQEFDDDKCISQTFIASDETEYESTNCNPIDEPEIEGYFPYEMIQPDHAEKIQNLSAATSNLLGQVGQMKGLFDDEDDTIKNAIKDAEDALKAMK